jgi:SAM-dependent methyltransferase
MHKTNRIAGKDFCRMFKYSADELPQIFLAALEKVETTHREANPGEFQEYVLDVLKKISNPYIARTAEENLEAFEKGWEENLWILKPEGLSSGSLRPKYFRPNKFLRYDKRLIVSDNLSLEYDLFDLARYLIFMRYLAPYEEIYELGCGSCQNLLLLSELFPSKRLFGLDWASSSVEIANLLARKFDKNVEGMRFDLLNPPPRSVFKPGSAVITIHSLEQIGTNYAKLLSLLTDSKLGLVLHYEPVLEFYDENNLLDYLAVMYSRKRNYLSGFLGALRRLRDEGRIKLLAAWRPYLGGVIHESSLIIWRPIH